MKSSNNRKAVFKDIPIDKIIVDPSISSRIQLSEETIFKYAQSLFNGDQFPPIDLYYNGSDYVLADGTHRLEAYRLENRDTIPAKVYEGGRNEAFVHAAGSNVKHGLLRNNRDKHHVVENVLKDSTLGVLSDNKIAEICAVSQPFVGKVRKMLTYNGYKFPEKRKTSDGRQMDTTNIGCNRNQNPQPIDASVGEALENVQQSANETEDQATTVACPAGDRSAEVTLAVVHPETEADQVETSNPVSENPSETLESSNPDAGVQREGIDLSAEPETEEVSEETSPDIGDVASPQEPETASPQVDEDIPTLKAKVSELQKALQAKELEIQEKDKVIEDLEAKIQAFEKDRAYYERQLEIYEKEEIARERAEKIRSQALAAM